MTEAEDGSPSPAEMFERFFGPSLFTPWSRVLLEHARPRPGERVLDLACATGIVARQVAPRVGEEGAVVGLDISPEMLAVAQERAEAEGVTVEWREGDAMDLDLPDASFDLALCQQGFQFFPDPPRALQEAHRVLKDGGRLVANVWQPLERQTVYRALLEAEARHLDADLAEVARPFAFGDDAHLRSLLDDAGFEHVAVDERSLDVEFPDPDTFVALTILAAAAVLPDAAPDDPEERDALIAAITDECSEVLAKYRDGDRLRFPTRNYIVLGRA